MKPVDEIKFCHQCLFLLPMQSSTIFKSFLEFRICFPGADVEAIHGVHRPFRPSKRPKSRSRVLVLTYYYLASWLVGKIQYI